LERIEDILALYRSQQSQQFRAFASNGFPRYNI